MGKSSCRRYLVLDAVPFLVRYGRDARDADMITVKLLMRVTNEPLKRTPVVLRMDADDSEKGPVLTDREGVARFMVPSASGKVLVSGVERYHGRLDGDILVDLWSITQSGSESEGMPGEFPAGSNAYPGMTMRRIPGRATERF